MSTKSTSANTLALLGLDGHSAAKLAFIESESTGTVFDLPPDWLEGVRRSMEVPYRVKAVVKPSLPVELDVIKALLEWSWRSKGLEVAGKPGWYEVDSETMAATLSTLLLTISVPSDALLLVNNLTRDANRSRSDPLRAGELWATSHALWGFAGGDDTTRTPAEWAADAFLEYIRQIVERGAPEPKGHRVAFDYFTQLTEKQGALSTSLQNALLQRYLGNMPGCSDALAEYLFELERSLDNGRANPLRVEQESLALLKALRREWAAKNEDCPELVSNLSLSFREALMTLCERHFDGDLTMLFWAKKQLVPSFMTDPSYRRYIIGGMVVCAGAVAYLAPQALLVMSVLGGLGYYIARKRA